MLPQRKAIISGFTLFGSVTKNECLRPPNLLARNERRTADTSQLVVFTGHGRGELMRAALVGSFY